MTHAPGSARAMSIAAIDPGGQKPLFVKGVGMSSFVLSADGFSPGKQPMQPKLSLGSRKQ